MKIRIKKDYNINIKLGSIFDVYRYDCINKIFVVFKDEHTTLYINEEEVTILQDPKFKIGDTVTTSNPYISAKIIDIENQISFIDGCFEVNYWIYRLDLETSCQRWYRESKLHKNKTLTDEIDEIKNDTFRELDKLKNTICGKIRKLGEECKKDIRVNFKTTLEL